MPLVSVIVPVYKVEPYLHRCVDSILHQSFSDFVLILVDDGSPDGCPAICDTYAEKDRRIHVIHQENGGLSAARNAGIDWAMAYSDSQWITFIDSDDWIHRDYLKDLTESAESSMADISMCNYMRTDTALKELVYDSNSTGMDPETAYVSYYGMCMTACCKLYRKHLFEGIRFPVRKLHEDAYVTHILLFRAKKISVCDVPLYHYFTNPGSITRAKWSEKRLQEIESHELRAAWLKEHGYEKAYRRETEVYVMTIYEHTEVLAKLSREDKTYRPYLESLRKKLKTALNQARKMGLYAFEREYLWIYLMAYGPEVLWYTGQWLRRKRSNM